MMRKNVKISLVILMLIALILPITYSYAIANSEEKSFFEISKLEVTKNDKIEMIINLDEIEYSKFVFELSSSENIEDIEVVDTEDLEAESETIELETNSYEVTIEIDKEITNLSTITLYYQIPETVEVGNIIKFVATITNIESDEELLEPETQTIEAEVKIVEEEENTNIQENTYQEVTNIEQNNQEIKETTQSTNEKSAGQGVNSATSTSQSSGVSTTSMSSDKTEQTVTYNGSDNNYLSELLVCDYTLNKEFSKDNSTYFLTVGSDVDSLNITATPADDTSTIYIYGNENLTEGTNKILICVTAENGNVRNYRIYVTKNS